MLNSALLHSTLGQCEEISDCFYTGQTFLKKRNINNVNELDDSEESDLEAGSDQAEGEVREDENQSEDDRETEGLAGADQVKDEQTDEKKEV